MFGVPVVLWNLTEVEFLVESLAGLGNTVHVMVTLSMTTLCLVTFSVRGNHRYRRVTKTCRKTNHMLLHANNNNNNNNNKTKSLKIMTRFTGKAKLNIMNFNMSSSQLSPISLAEILSSFLCSLTLGIGHITCS